MINKFINKSINKYIINQQSNKFILLLRKGVHVYSYEFKDDWEKFNEKSLPEKEEIYSNLNTENITDSDYNHSKRICKDIEIRNFGKYHDFYLKIDILLLADVLENFREIYELSTPGLARKAALKKTKAKLELLTDTDMLLMVEKKIRGGLCHSINRYANSNNKYRKNYAKNKESYLNYWNVNKLYGWAMPQKLPVNGFKWFEDRSEFKSYNEKGN